MGWGGVARQRCTPARRGEVGNVKGAPRATQARCPDTVSSGFQFQPVRGVRLADVRQTRPTRAAGSAGRHNAGGRPQPCPPSRPSPPQRTPPPKSSATALSPARRAQQPPSKPPSPAAQHGRRHRRRSNSLPVCTGPTLPTARSQRRAPKSNHHHPTQDDKSITSPQPSSASLNQHHSQRSIDRRKQVQRRRHKER